MSSVEKISIAVTPELAARVRDAVNSGEYASASEVVREALRDWNRKREERQAAFEELGRQWDAGKASGPPQPGPTVFARLRAELKKVDEGPAR
jgi:antitoxin ParD1/3/4